MEPLQNENVPSNEREITEELRMLIAGKGKKAEKEKKVKTERAGTRRLGVSGKLILNMAIPTGVILTLLTIVLVMVTTTTIHGLKNKDIETQLEDVSEQVEQYFETSRKIQRGSSSF